MVSNMPKLKYYLSSFLRLIHNALTINSFISEICILAAKWRVWNRSSCVPVWGFHGFFYTRTKMRVILPLKEASLSFCYEIWIFMRCLNFISYIYKNILHSVISKTIKISSQTNFKKYHSFSAKSYRVMMFWILWIFSIFQHWKTNLSVLMQENAEKSQNSKYHNSVQSI